MISDEEQLVAEYLGDLGFSVTKLEEGAKQIADFRVKGRRDTYLVEIKSKQSNPMKLARFLSSLQEKGIAEESEPMRRGGRIPEVVRSGAHQLRATHTKGGPYRLLWLVAMGHHPNVQVSQFRSSLYGIVNIVDFDDPSALASRDCFYFEESDFYRYRHVLDGAIIGTLEKCQLCLNNHAKHSDQLRRSELAIAFGEAVVDPEVLAQSNRIWLADTGEARGNPAAVLKYVQAKYGRRRLSVMWQSEMFSVTAEVRMDNGS